MELKYFEPHAALKPLVSSYYYCGMPAGRVDLIRAESPNLRFFFGGGATSSGRFNTDRLDGPGAILFGATSQASLVNFDPGTRLFGVSLTPLGWRRCVGESLDAFADRIEDFANLEPRRVPETLERLMEARCETEWVSAVDDLLLRLASRPARADEAFIAAAADWLGDPALAGVDGLIARIGRSSRQTERLCRQYFGAPPKRLFRKFRALHASNAIAWSDAYDWREMAHPSYYDQSHFIRDFKEFVGCTPRSFAQGPNLLIRLNLIKRLSVSHHSRFSLAG